MKTLLIATITAGICIAAPPRKPMKIVLVGDSTINPEGGWGPGFQACFPKDVEVINLAANGRSSKSFRDEKRWQPALDAKPDYIIIAFGHNDVPGKGPDRETDPTTTYRVNMARYIDEARAAGATPVLATSIVRRNFDENGKLKVDSLAPYVTVTRELAAEKHIPLMDLYAATWEQTEKLGNAGSEGNIGRSAPDGKPDHTHLGPKGQASIGAIAATEFVKAVPEMAQYWQPSVAR